MILNGFAFFPSSEEHLSYTERNVREKNHQTFFIESDEAFLLEVFLWDSSVNDKGYVEHDCYCTAANNKFVQTNKGNT